MQVPDGSVLLWLCHLLRLDERLHRPPTFKTRRRHCVHQRIFAIGEYCGFIYLADNVGPVLPVFIWNLHCNEWIGHPHVVRFPTTLGAAQ